jgi:molybdopterin/thiamine biosynthesis adenylyltransferase
MVAVIGCGGIGSWLIPPLARYLASIDFTGELRLCDGDKYDRNNTDRQNFPAQALGVNKAVVQAEKLRFDLPAMNIVSIGDYVTKDNAGRVMAENSICFAAVDNHPARKRLAEQLQLLDNGALISAGNEKVDGNACLYLREKGEDVTENLLTRHPEIAIKKDGDREAGCEAQIASGEVQLLMTNFSAAHSSLIVFYQLMNKGKRFGKRTLTDIPQEAFFDVVDGTTSVIQAVKRGRNASVAS